MNRPSWMNGPPKKILLATDLSPRCDRALDRAVSLAAQWKAKLIVIHVLERPGISETDARVPSWRRPPDPASATRRQLIADVGALAKKATVVIEEGDPANAVLRRAETEGCDLIVTGIARDELLGRFHLGKSVDRLLRRSRVPVLVVKNRVRHPYRHIVVATDFSKSSRHALEAAAHFFKGQKLTVFHAYDAPMAGLVSDTDSYQKDYRKVAVQQCQDFLKDADKPRGAWKIPNVVIEYGEPSLLLHEYARDNTADLVVLGTHGRSALFEVIIGSVAKRIMESLPCDALVVREPRAKVEA